MTRSDTLAAIASRCRRSHAASLLAVGYMTLDATTEVLEELLLALGEQDEIDVVLSHLVLVERLLAERHGTASRLD